MPVKHAHARRSGADRDRQPRRTAGLAAAAPARVAAALPTTTCRTTGRRSSARACTRTTCARWRTWPNSRSPTKADLRDNYPFGMFAVPREQVVRIHASSGTTGKPTVVGYTQADIDNWSDLVARSIRAAGGRAGDIVHVAYGYGLFTGGLGAHYGAERLGCTVIPMSGGQTEKQVQLINDFKPRHHHGHAQLHAGDHRGIPAPGHGPARDVASRSASSAPSRGPRRCGARSRPAPASMRSTSTACPRSWGRAWPTNASSPRTVR